MPLMDFMKPTDKEIEKLALDECDARNYDKYLPICVGKILTVITVFIALLMSAPVIMVKMVKPIFLSLCRLVKIAFRR